MGLPNWAFILVVAAAVMGVILLRRALSGSPAQQQGTTPPPTTAAGNCTDANGNPAPCYQATTAGQLATLQAEIDSLQGAPSVPVASTSTIPVTTGTQPGVVTQPTMQPQPATPAPLAPVRIPVAPPISAAVPAQPRSA